MLNRKVFKPYSQYLASQSPRGILRQKYDLSLGESINNFEVSSLRHIKEFKINQVNLTYNQIGKYIHLDSDVTNNAMGIVFPSPSNNNYGTCLAVQRLIQHCGSEMYPVRDTMQRMQSNSLSRTLSLDTLHSLQGQQYSSFMFNSTNQKDFKQLLNVYLEMIFNARLTEEEFNCSVKRLGFREPFNPSSELCYKGEFIEEVQGVMNTPDQIFIAHQQSTLYAGNSHQYLSAGLPQQINAHLTYQHTLHYYHHWINFHNAQFISFGDLDFREHLDIINQFQQKYQLIERDNTYQQTKDSSNKDNQQENQLEVLQQESFYLQENVVQMAHPTEQTVRCPPDPYLGSYVDQEQLLTVGYSYLVREEDLNKAGIHLEREVINLAMQLMQQLMFDSQNGPLYTYLEDDKDQLAQYCPGYGYYDNPIGHSLNASYTIGFKHIHQDQLKHVQTIIWDYLDAIVQQGFDKQQVQNMVAQLEMNSRFPDRELGLTIIQSYGGSLISNWEGFGVQLEVNRLITILRKQIQQGLLEKLVKIVMIDNPHRVQVKMRSQHNYISQQIDDEALALRKYKNTITGEKVDEILEREEEVQKNRSRLQDEETLPRLSLIDIDCSLPTADLVVEEKSVEGVKVQLVQVNMNGTSKVRMVIDISHLPDSLLCYVPALVGFLSKIGNESMSSEEVFYLREKESVQIDCSYQTCIPPGEDRVKHLLLIEGVSLDSHLPALFNSMAVLVVSPDFSDLQSLSQILKYHSAEQVQYITQFTGQVAQQASASVYAQELIINNTIKNTRFICDFAKKLLKSADARHSLLQLQQAFYAILSDIFRQQQISFIIHSDNKNWQRINRRVELILNSLSLKHPVFTTPVDQQQLLERQKEQDRQEQEEEDSKSPEQKENERQSKVYIAVSQKSNYVSESMKVERFLGSESPVLKIVAELCGLFLQSVLVEELGCVKVLVNYDSSRGVFSLTSLQDPHTLQTFLHFEHSLSHLSSSLFSDLDLYQAKVSLFKQLDHDLKTEDKGLSSLLFGVTVSQQQVFRQAVLMTDRQQVIKVSTSLLEQMKKGSTSQVILGAQTNHLEGFLSRGWQLQQFVDDLSLNEESYEPNQEHLLSQILNHDPFIAS